MNDISTNTGMAQTEMPVHETLTERLAAAESAEDRSKLICAWTQEETDHKREIYRDTRRVPRDLTSGVKPTA